MKAQKKNRFQSLRGWLQMFRIYGSIRFPWLLLLISIGLGIVATQVNVLVPRATQEIVDSNGTNSQALVLYIVCTLAVALLTLGKELIAWFSYEKINQRVRSKVWEKILNIRMQDFDKENASYYISRITSDADSIYSPIYAMVNMALALYSMGIYTYNMFIVNPVMARYVVLVLPLGIFLAALMGRFKFKASYRTRQENAKAVRYMTERTKNIKLIKAQRAQKQEDRISQDVFTDQWKAAKYMALIEIICLPLGFLITNSSKIISYGIGGYYASLGWMSAGSVISFQTYAALVCTQAWIGLYLYPLSLKSSQGTMAKIADILQLKPEADGQSQHPDANKDIILDKVSFSYGEKRVLQEVDARIPNGKVTVLLGANGSGKTTLFKLLEKFYTPESGQILLGTQSLCELNTTAWRKSVGFVPQNCDLMDGTLRENLLYGLDTPVTDEEIMEALHAVNAEKMVHDMPKGLDSDVGEAGGFLSGGERQRLSIARMLLRKPEILLLDEATCAMDGHSEKTVLDSIAHYALGRTVVMIAHTASAARLADHAIILDAGKVVAVGTPEELEDRFPWNKTA